MRKRQGRFCYEVGMSKLSFFRVISPPLSFFSPPLSCQAPFFPPPIKDLSSFHQKFNCKPCFFNSTFFSFNLKLKEK